MIAERNKYKDLLVIVVGFCLIGLLIAKGYDKPGGWYFIYSALGLGVICIFSETLTRWVTTAWQHFGKFLGKINSTILLSVIFILMLAPLSILKRLTSGKEMAPDDSNWTTVDPSSPVNFEKLW